MFEAERPKNLPGPISPFTHPKIPFGIFYVVESNRIVVHAFPDLRQDPKKIRERFSE
jgi:hypothetical protein